MDNERVLEKIEELMKQHKFSKYRLAKESEIGRASCRERV